MSLINDALKRASQSSKQNPPGKGPTPGSPLQPVVGGRPRKVKINFAVLAISLLVILVLGGATWGFMSWRKHSKTAPKNASASKQPEKAGTATNTAAQTPRTPSGSNQTAAAEPSQPVSQTPRSTPAASPSTPQTEKPASASTPAKPQPATPTQTVSVKPQKPASADPGSTATPAAAPPSTPRTDPPKGGIPTAAKVFPAIKLQGIAFRIKNPSVLINGKVLELGEELDGVVVKKIERNSVTLEWSGQTKVFSLK